MKIAESTLPLPGNATPATFGRLAEDAGRRAFFFTKPDSSQVFALFRDAAGGSSVVALPGSHVTDLRAQVDAMLIGDRLWTLTGRGPLIVNEYQLAGSPLPTSATALGGATFGDASSRTLGDCFIRLKSGAMLCMWYRGDLQTTARYGFAYKPASTASWQTLGPVDIAGGSGTISNKQTLVEHPAGRIEAIIKREGAHCIDRILLHESAWGLVIDSVQPAFVDNAVGKDGLNGPDGEFPDLVSVADPTRNCVWVAYQSWNRKILSTSPFVAVAKPVLLAVGADGGKSFVTWPDATWAERCRGLALFLRGDTLFLAYRKIVETALTQPEIWARPYDVTAKAWGDPVYLGKARPIAFGYNAWDELGYASVAGETLSTQKDAAGAVTVRAWDLGINSPVAVTYTLNYQNGAEAQRLHLETFVPAGVQWVSGGTFSEGKVWWDLDLTPGQAGQVSWTGRK